MKTTKRIAALLMAVVMVFAMSAVALAEGPGVSTLGEDKEFSFKKGIYVRNHVEGNYYSPNVTYTYTITPATEAERALGAHVANIGVYPAPNGGLVGTANSTVNDSEGNVTVTVPFTSKVVNGVNPEGKVVEETVTFKVDASAFADITQGGVYRYKITDTTSNDVLNAAGIVRGTYDKDRFVDVYISVTTSGGGTTVTPETVVVSNQGQVPVTDEDGKYVDADGTKYDPKDGYKVDEDGTILKPKDGTSAPYDDDDYEPVIDNGTGEPKKAEMEDGLIKDGDVFDETPTPKDEDNDDNPDKEPATDDDGNPIGTDGNTYPEPEYHVDPNDGTIHKVKDDPSNDPPVYPADYEDEAVKDQNGDDVKQREYTKFDYPGDTYMTYNVKVTKVVTGAYGDKNHQFPFTANITNNTLAYNTSAENGITSDTVSFKIKSGESFYIRGLSPHATVNYTEKNDTALPYTATAKDSANSTVNADKTLNQGDTYTVYASPMKVTDYTTNTTEGVLTGAGDVTVTNAQTTFSPTGVVLRFAPYILMLGAAMFFVVLARRQREQENA